MRIANIVAELNEEQVKGLVASEVSKSQKIKAMFESGMDVKEISGILGIRYNHAYNVIQNHIIVNEIEVVKQARAAGAKRVEIESLLLEGKSNIEVAKALKTTYNSVWKIKNELISAGKLENETPKVKVEITKEEEKTPVKKTKAKKEEK